MLVLSRHQDQQIIFPDAGITLSFIQLSSRRVRVGIDAPPEVAVLRGELASEMGNAEAPNTSRAASPLHHIECKTFSVTDSRLQRRLHVAVKALDELAGVCGREQLEDAKPYLKQVLHELSAIDTEAALVHDRPARINRPTRTALLVDDNQNEAKLLASFLRFRNFEVALAEDGQAAMEYLEDNEQPDVVLLDMVMPRQDGATTVRLLRENQSHQSLRIFGVSGGTPEDYGVTLDEEGVNGWFQKPVDPEQMILQLNRGRDESRADTDTLASKSEGTFILPPV